MWKPPLGQPQQAGAGFFVALVGFIAYGFRKLMGRTDKNRGVADVAADSERDRDEDPTG